jgi:hypothetical protein
VGSPRKADRWTFPGLMRSLGYPARGPASWRRRSKFWPDNLFAFRLVPRLFGPRARKLRLPHAPPPQNGSWWRAECSQAGLLLCADQNRWAFVIARFASALDVSFAMGTGAVLAAQMLKRQIPQRHSRLGSHPNHSRPAESRFGSRISLVALLPGALVGRRGQRRLEAQECLGVRAVQPRPSTGVALGAGRSGGPLRSLRTRRTSLALRADGPLRALCTLSTAGEH